MIIRGAEPKDVAAILDLIIGLAMLGTETQRPLSPLAHSGTR